ncbi:DgyrCDS6913 [Dimorphilus gyrociliatus]|nr:DgyrCDS6913 [Dimorphilus gyrociliatus]
MIRSNVFIRKTKRGKILKVVREHYLRDDVYCSFPKCEQCEEEKPIFSSNPSVDSKELVGKYLIIPDSNVVLHQMDILEDSSIRNVIILQTVYGEVLHRSAIAYKKLKDCLSNPEKKFYLFMNEFHRDTFIERDQKESPNDRNDRAIRTAALWYQKHLKPYEVEILLVTNDQSNKNLALESGIKTNTVEKFVKSLKNCDELADKLALTREASSSTGKTAVFEEHLPLSSIQVGLKSGSYIQGTFHASRDNYLEASVDVYEKDGLSILIQGQQHMNRAMQGDTVAIEILPESEWQSSSSLILEDDGEKNDESTISEDKKILQDISNKSEKKPCGKVVGIIKRNWRQFCGMLQKSLIETATRHLVIPADKRIPKIRIETRQADVLDGKRILVVIDSWPRTSRYPLGHFVRNLGAIGDKKTENEVLLIEHDIPHHQFSTAVRACLPSLPWSITEEDLKQRKDLRDLTVVSVDPPGCTDIDDALHCFQLDNGNYEVGVHIADVSHFIKPGTAIDVEAANRANTVYLIDQRIDMVPELLSSNICSLRGGEERFAFSVIWELDENAKVVNVKFTKSIIKSKAALTYAEAQMRIDDSQQTDDVTKSLRLLNKLAKILKQERIKQGSLTLASPEVRFHMDSETHDPIEVQTKQLLETNSMVEEFMLLANIATAKKIYDEFPSCALLRRHPEPPSSNFESLIKSAESKGFTLNVTSGKMLAESLEKSVLESNSYFNTMLRIMATRCMLQALYFCSGVVDQKDFYHYGLAAPIYTHFTSPIRR